MKNTDKFHLIMNVKKRIAFTLAEVLITLLIIGVVASLVIPTLISETQNAEFYTLLKKDYSSLSDAGKKMMIDNGGNLKGYFDNAIMIQQKFKENMIFTKNCTFNQQGCFYAGNNTWKNLYGNYGWFDYTNYLTSIISNGGTIMFGYHNSDCADNNGTGGPAEYTCGILLLDVNGFKNPNILGRDIFGFWITKSGIFPFGTSNDLYSNWNILCNKDNSHDMSGIGCSAKILGGGKVD